MTEREEQVAPGNGGGDERVRDDRTTVGPAADNRVAADAPPALETSPAPDTSAAHDAAPSPVAAPGVTRRLLAASGRAGLALAAGGLAVALGAAVLLVPGPVLAPEAARVAVTPDRADQTIVCPGGVLGLTLGENPRLTVAAEPRRTTAGTGITEGVLESSDALPAEDDGAVTLPATPPATVTLPVSAPDEVLAATETARIISPDLAGFSAAECLPAERTAWLVGGDTTVGRTSWVSLANPGPVDASADLMLWGADGPIAVAGATGLIVPAGHQRVIALDGLAVEEASPVVGVTSRAGSVVATLQTSTVRGLEPAGVSVITPVVEASTRVVIPALPIIDTELLQQRSSSAGIDILPTLRMLAPGTGAASVTVRLVSASGGDTAGAPILAELEPGIVLDLPLTELPDGEYSVIIDSSEPVVAGVRASTVDANPDTADLPGPVAPGTVPSIDHAWFSGATALEPGTTTVAAVGPVSGATARLHLIAPDGDASVDLDGRLIEVPAGLSVSVSVAATTPLRLSIDGSAVHAGITYRGDAQLAGTRVLPPASATAPLVIYPQ